MSATSEPLLCANSGPLEPLLSVIVPVGPGEDKLARLLAELLLLPPQTQIVLAGCSESMPQLNALSLPPRLQQRTRIVEAPRGRASQMNLGAQSAQGEFLWFLHADSLINPWLVEQLLQGLQNAPRGLHFFRLRFSESIQPPVRNRRLIRINAIGAHLRSAWLGVPFGDQGFCLSAQRFRQLGGYDERARYGEDHLLLWQARRQGVQCCYHDATITTSARKYRQQGWLRLTLRYQWLWLKQALPQWWLQLRQR